MTDEELDWEALARDGLANDIENHLVEDVDGSVWDLITEFKNGERPEEEFWEMMESLTLFSAQVGEILKRTGDLEQDAPAMRLFSQGRTLQEMFLLLGQDIEAGTVGESRLGYPTVRGGVEGPSEGFDVLREQLDHAREVLDELEREYQSKTGCDERGDT